METKRWASMSTTSRSTTDGQSHDKNGSPTRHKCRRCAQSFDSRNKLMRHVFGDHPPPGSARRETSNAPRKTPAATVGPPAEPKSPTTSTGTPTPDAIPLSPVESHGENNDNYTTERPRTQHYHPHPFVTFSKEQQLIFVFRILYVLFNVAMKQHEEAKQNQQRLQRLGHWDWDVITPEPVTPPESPVAVSPTMAFVAPTEQRHRVLSISSTSTLNPLASEFRMMPTESSCPGSYEAQRDDSPVNECLPILSGDDLAVEKSDPIQPGSPSPTQKQAPAKVPKKEASTDPSLQDPAEAGEALKIQETEKSHGGNNNNSGSHDLESEDEDDNDGGAHLVWLDEEEDDEDTAPRGVSLQNKDSPATQLRASRGV
ncbi:hypothetical protein B0T21DRAFT_357898 [Apiosordaria backusii]|uniref:C2H2-type domain-containing protein n=1 Tax=Apiosordaria backusii TaxID=314023 RepID=A0AA40ES93_9PEZI|nr:hypothetical protein B0T21DRAFT_357898 [Apiosordaria backusii]